MKKKLFLFLLLPLRTGSVNLNPSADFFIIEKAVYRFQTFTYNGQMVRFQLTPKEITLLYG